jgi:hypothetical protein
VTDYINLSVSFLSNSLPRGMPDTKPPTRPLRSCRIMRSASGYPAPTATISTDPMWSIASSLHPSTTARQTMTPYWFRWTAAITRSKVSVLPSHLPLAQLHFPFDCAADDNFSLSNGLLFSHRLPTQTRRARPRGRLGPALHLPGGRAGARALRVRHDSLGEPRRPGSGQPFHGEEEIRGNGSLLQ